MMRPMGKCSCTTCKIVRQNQGINSASHVLVRPQLTVGDLAVLSFFLEYPKAKLQRGFEMEEALLLLTCVPLKKGFSLTKIATLGLPPISNLNEYSSRSRSF